MNQIIFKQDKPITVIIIGLLLLVLPVFSYNGFVEIIPILSIALLLLGYRVSYKIDKEYNNKKIISFFGIPIIITKLVIIYPEYISLFGANFSKRNDWGPIASIGTNSNADKIVVRLFKGGENFTVYKSSKNDKSRELAVQLSELLKVKLIDNTSN